MGKRIQRLALKNLGTKVLNLGYVGENEHTQIVIDCSEVLWDYSDAVASVVVQPPRGDMYPVEVTRDEDSIIWEIADSDLVYSGTGRVQITFTNDGEIVKSAIGNTRIEASIMATGPAPTPLENWMEQAEETAHQIALTAKDEVIEQIQDAAEEARESIPADYTQLSDDVTELKSAFEQLNDNVITDSAGPSPIVSIADGADGMRMRKVEVAIEPVQDLHGYDAPWPAGGGKNLLPDDFPILPQSSVAVNKSNCFFVKAGTYVVSFEGAQNMTSFRWCIYMFDENGNSLLDAAHKPRDGYGNTGSYWRAGSNIAVTTKNETGALTIVEDCYIRICVGIGDVTASSVVNNAMLESGSAATDYAPYSNIRPISGWTGAKVTRTGKNLLDKSLGKLYGTYFVFGGTTTELDNTLFLRNGTYTISTSGPVNVYIEDENQNRIITPQYRATSVTFTNPKDQYCKLSFGRASGEQPTPDAYDYQLEFGSVATDYEPYLGQTYEVTFPAEAGTVYGGTLDVVSGKLVVDKYELILTGNESYNTYGNYQYIKTDACNAAVTGVLYANCAPTDTHKKAKCNQLKATNSISIWTSVGCPNQFSLNGQSGQLHLNLANNLIGVTDPMQETPDTIRGKIQAYVKAQYDAGTPLKFILELPNPVPYTITPQEIKTLLGINNVWSDAGNTAITYPADTKLYIDNKIAELQALILENNG